MNMKNPIFDFSDGDFIFSSSDTFGIDSDGNSMIRMSDNMAIDMDSGEVHFVSGWNLDNEDE